MFGYSSETTLSVFMKFYTLYDLQGWLLTFFKLFNDNKYILLIK